MNRLLASLTFLLNLLYLGWLFVHVSGVWGMGFFVAELAISSLTLLFIVNHWSQKHIHHHHNRSPKGLVDVFLTIVDEPVHIFEPVLKAAMGIDYADKKIFVLDDGPREEIKKLVEQYGAVYYARPDIQKDAKAGNLNYGLKQSSGEYILVLDADQKVTNPQMIKELLGHFEDDTNVASIGTRQTFDVPPGDYNHDVMFYEHIQTGKNDDNAPICVGSGVIYRREALSAIGGFQTWNLVEDLYTSYIFQSKGYQTLYINKSYTLGMAPLDLAGIWRQRGTWAVDTMRMFFKDNPLLKKGLSLRQRLHYFEISYSYIVAAFAVPFLFVLPAISLWLGVSFIDAPLEYIILRLPSLIFMLVFYYHVGGNTFIGNQFWASLFPVYLKATILGLMPGKPGYAVTPKVGTGKRDTLLIIPHLLVLLILLGSVATYLIRSGFDMLLSVNLIWVSLTFFWFYPVIHKGFVKE